MGFRSFFVSLFTPERGRERGERERERERESSPQMRMRYLRGMRNVMIVRMDRMAIDSQHKKGTLQASKLRERERGYTKVR